MASKFNKICGLWEPKKEGGKTVASCLVKEGCAFTIPPGGKIMLFKNEQRPDKNDPIYNLVWVEAGEYQPGGGGVGSPPDDLPF